MRDARHDLIRAAVRGAYATVATRQTPCCGVAAGCCSNPPDATRLGYGAEEQAAVPEGADLGLGCGNPQAIAALLPGESVVDLGCGAGFDVFLAARKVGPRGSVIGIDMTPEMLARARANALKTGLGNVDFRLGEIEHLPVADASVDVILSNCAINLSPQKAAVLREAFRVLKAGGRLAVTDIVATAPLPPELRADPALLSGCVAGAAQVGELEAWLREAGFAQIRIEIDAASRELIRDWFPGSGAERYVASARIMAHKP